MTIKRIIVTLSSIALFCFSLIIGRGFLLGYYRQEADVALFLSGDYQTAIKYYNKLIFWHPTAPGLYYKRGNAYVGVKQFKVAIQDYNKSLELGTPDSLQALLRIALAAKEEEDLQLEEKTLNKLMELSRNRSSLEYWAANYHLGQLEYKKKNYRRAVELYNTAHLASPSDLELYHRANAYYALGELDSARQDLNRTIKFIKSDYVKKHPESFLAKCDTCAFPFGTKEYENLTNAEPETILQTLDKLRDNKTIDAIDDKLHKAERSEK